MLAHSDVKKVEAVGEAVRMTVAAVTVPQPDLRAGSSAAELTIHFAPSTMGVATLHTCLEAWSARQLPKLRHLLSEQPPPPTRRFGELTPVSGAGAAASPGAGAGAGAGAGVSSESPGWSLTSLEWSAAEERITQEVKSGRLRGAINLGNTCYMSAVLAALLNTVLSRILLDATPFSMVLAYRRAATVAEWLAARPERGVGTGPGVALRAAMDAIAAGMMGGAPPTVAPAAALDALSAATAAAAAAGLRRSPADGGSGGAVSSTFGAHVSARAKSELPGLIRTRVGSMAIPRFEFALVVLDSLRGSFARAKLPAHLVHYPFYARANEPPSGAATGRGAAGSPTVVGAAAAATARPAATPSPTNVGAADTAAAGEVVVIDSDDDGESDGEGEGGAAAASAAAATAPLPSDLRIDLAASGRRFHQDMMLALLGHADPLISRPLSLLALQPLPSPPPPRNSMVAALTMLMQRRLAGGYMGERELRKVQAAAAGYISDFGSRQQQDAHEFLSTVCSALEAEAGAVGVDTATVCGLWAIDGLDFGEVSSRLARLSTVWQRVRGAAMDILERRAAKLEAVDREKRYGVYRGLVADPAALAGSPARRPSVPSDDAAVDHADDEVEAAVARKPVAQLPVRLRQVAADIPGVRSVATAEWLAANGDEYDAEGLPPLIYVPELFEALAACGMSLEELERHAVACARARAEATETGRRTGVTARTLEMRVRCILICRNPLCQYTRSRVEHFRELSLDLPLTDKIQAEIAAADAAVAAARARATASAADPVASGGRVGAGAGASAASAAPSKGDTAAVAAASDRTSPASGASDETMHIDEATRRRLLSVPHEEVVNLSNDEQVKWLILATAASGDAVEPAAGGNGSAVGVGSKRPRGGADATADGKGGDGGRPAAKVARGADGTPVRRHAGSPVSPSGVEDGDRDSDGEEEEDDDDAATVDVELGGPDDPIDATDVPAMDVNRLSAYFPPDAPLHHADPEPDLVAGYDLQELLNNFFRSRIVGMRCDRANCNSGTVLALFEIAQLPRTLVLQVKRFVTNKYFTRVWKRTEQISIPASLSVAQLCGETVALPPPLDLKPEAAVMKQIRNTFDATKERLEKAVERPAIATPTTSRVVSALGGVAGRGSSISSGGGSASASTAFRSPATTPTFNAPAKIFPQGTGSGGKLAIMSSGGSGGGGGSTARSVATAAGGRYSTTTYTHIPADAAMSHHTPPLSGGDLARTGSTHRLSVVQENFGRPSVAINQRKVNAHLGIAGNLGGRGGGGGGGRGGASGGHLAKYAAADGDDCEEAVDGPSARPRGGFDDGSSAGTAPPNATRRLHGAHHRRGSGDSDGCSGAMGAAASALSMLGLGDDARLLARNRGRDPATSCAGDGDGDAAAAREAAAVFGPMHDAHAGGVARLLGSGRHDRGAHRGGRGGGGGGGGGGDGGKRKRHRHRGRHFSPDSTDAVRSGQVAGLPGDFITDFDDDSDGFDGIDTPDKGSASAGTRYTATAPAAQAPSSPASLPFDGSQLTVPPSIGSESVVVVIDDDAIAASAASAEVAATTPPRTRSADLSSAPRHEREAPASASSAATTVASSGRGSDAASVPPVPIDPDVWTLVDYVLEAMAPTPLRLGARADEHRRAAAAVAGEREAAILSGDPSSLRPLPAGFARRPVHHHDSSVAQWAPQPGRHVLVVPATSRRLTIAPCPPVACTTNTAQLAGEVAPAPGVAAVLAPATPTAAAGAGTGAGAAASGGAPTEPSLADLMRPRTVGSVAPTYDLRSVVRHSSESTVRGHYTTDTCGLFHVDLQGFKCPAPGSGSGSGGGGGGVDGCGEAFDAHNRSRAQWYRYDDDVVREVSWSNVSSQQSRELGYIYVYELREALPADHTLSKAIGVATSAAMGPAADPPTASPPPAYGHTYSPSLPLWTGPLQQTRVTGGGSTWNAR